MLSHYNDLILQIDVQFGMLPDGIDPTGMIQITINHGNILSMISYNFFSCTYRMDVDHL